MKKMKYVWVLSVILMVVIILNGCATPGRKVYKVTEAKSVPSEQTTKKKEISVPTLKKIFLVKKEIVYFPDGSIDTIREYSYNNTGNLIMEIQKTSDGDILSKVQYDYTDNVLHKKTIYNEKEEVLTYYIYKFEDGNLLSVIQYDSKDNVQTVSKYKYDKSGNKILWEVFDGKGIKMAFTKYYYNNGKVVKKEIYGPNSNLESYIEINYSGDKKVKEGYFDSQGKTEKYIIYKYSNDLLQNELYYKSTGDIIRTISYKYDADKNVKEIIIKDSKGNVIERIVRNYTEFVKK